MSLQPTSQADPLLSAQQAILVAKTLGGYIPGGLLGAWFGGIVAVEAIRGLRIIPVDRVRTRMLIGTILLLNLAYTLIFSWVTYYYSVGGFGDYVQLNRITPLLGLHVVLTKILLTVSHLFFANRVRILSNQNIYWMISLFSAILSHVSIGVVLLTKLFTANTYEQLREYTGLVEISYVSSISCDIIITAALLYYLEKQRSLYQLTKSIIARIMLLSLQSTLITTTMTIVTVSIVRKVGPGTICSLTYISGQIYMLSILLTINTRLSFTRNMDLVEGIHVEQIVFTNVECDASPVTRSVAETLLQKRYRHFLDQQQSKMSHPESLSVNIPQFSMEEEKSSISGVDGGLQLKELQSDDHHSPQEVPLQHCPTT